MNLLKYVANEMTSWLPDWQAGLYISILAILILTGKSRAALVLLFISAYFWGVIYFRNNPVLMGGGDPLFRAIFYASGILVTVGMVIVFWLRRVT